MGEEKETDTGRKRMVGEVGVAGWLCKAGHMCLLRNQLCNKILNANVWWQRMSVVVNRQGRNRIIIV